MTNHLARSNNDLRQQQAAGLREWARDQPVGVISIGDFNMDYSFKRKKGNDAFPEMLRDNIWKWIPPEPLVDTQWSDNYGNCLLYTSPSPRDQRGSRMPSSA